jgi:hypothetical protein
MDTYITASHPNESKFDCKKLQKMNMCMAAQYKPREPVAVSLAL